MGLPLCLCLCLCLGIGALPTHKFVARIDGWGRPIHNDELGRVFRHPIKGTWGTNMVRCSEVDTRSLLDEKDDYPICKDNWEAHRMQHPGKGCIAYDIGVRQEAGFALKMIEDFSCSVRAYDPSRVTAQWYDNDWNAQGAGMPDKDVLRDSNQVGARKLHVHESAGLYKLFREAAGEKDGNLTLYSYAWQQVSNFRATDETKDKQQAFVVKSNSLDTMMLNNGDTYIDVLKIDIEGSEIPFLNGVFDKGCPPVELMLLEWHTQDIDEEITGAPAAVTELEKRMEKCGYQKYFRVDFFGPNYATETPNDKKRSQGWDMAGQYFGHAGYCRRCGARDVEM